jgi:hypothetical protein
MPRVFQRKLGTLEKRNVRTLQTVVLGEENLGTTETWINSVHFKNGKAHPSD